jgi:hypothetical protein
MLKSCEAEANGTFAIATPLVQDCAHTIAGDAIAFPGLRKVRYYEAHNVDAVADDDTQNRVPQAPRCRQKGLRYHRVFTPKRKKSIGDMV